MGGIVPMGGILPPPVGGYVGVGGYVDMLPTPPPTGGMLPPPTGGPLPTEGMLPPRLPADGAEMRRDDNARRKASARAESFMVVCGLGGREL